jgi:hypothetical protein
VQKELKNKNWIKNLGNINSQSLLDEYVALFQCLQSVQLSEDEDEIQWRWTASKQYTTKSAYEIQLFGSFQPFKASLIWHAKTEHRHKLFAWLVDQEKAPTANNLIKKSWPCNAICPMCLCLPETASHLLSECNFAEAAWGSFIQQLNAQPPISDFCANGTMSWFQQIAATGSKRLQRKRAGVVFLFWWHVWKERNRRIFEGKESSFLQVANLAAENYRMLKNAAINN